MLSLACYFALGQLVWHCLLERCFGHTRILSFWTAVPGWRLELAFGDFMHDTYMGNSRDCVASVIMDLVERGHIIGADGVAFPSKDHALKVLSMEFKDWCSDNKLVAPAVHFSLANLGRTSQTEYPELSSNFKAGHTKLLVGFLAHLTHELSLSDERSKCRAVMCYSLAQVLHILDLAGRRMMPHEIREAQHYGYLYLNCYQKMAHSALTSGQCLYKIKPKYHYLDHHFADLSDGWNPRYRHLFMDETFMGMLARLGRGVHRVTLSFRLLQRYVLFIANRWERRRRSGMLRV